MIGRGLLVVSIEKNNSILNLSVWKIDCGYGSYVDDALSTYSFYGDYGFGLVEYSSVFDNICNLLL